MFYVGMNLDKETNKQYKAEKTAIAAAEKESAKVFDEDGAVIADYTTTEGQPPEDNAPEDTTTEGQPPEVEGASGTVRRIFPGVLRVRNRPSWDASAVAGVTNFTEKRVVERLTVDDKPMFRLSDGLYITGDPKLVEFIAD